MARAATVLELFHPAVREWFTRSFTAPTQAQQKGWPSIARGENTLLLAPTGSGKTLAAFLVCLDRLMFAPAPDPRQRCRVVYVSPLKALAVDVERNLRAPLIGISQVAAQLGEAHHAPSIWVRSGDTPQAERVKFARNPSDILITTPESLYLILTSNAREALRGVDTVIVDEIHALVPTKRGAHLALTLERLERLTGRRLQRIGLSATQRPLDEVARFLGGAEPRSSATKPAKGRAEDAQAQLHHEFEAGAGKVKYRPVTLADAGARRALELKIEVPVEDMARMGQPVGLGKPGATTADIPSGPASAGPVRASIWSAIHPRLVELIRSHRSTLLFVNSRRIAERLAAALNELAGETLAYAHHGSLAKDQRAVIEDRLKAGEVKALVATSSLELGIDMGAIDLVVQIEAPPSVASGLQRIGRAGHQVGGVSRGIIFPKYRGDLVACAALTRAMREGQVEASRYPRNPLDVLAQQIVATVADEPMPVEELFALVRSAAPFAELSRTVFEGVLDMLAGRYVSDDFAELRPRVVWDRVKDVVKGREGAKRVAVVNAGTIPDRGLYGVFLAGAEKGQARVGELDEEMVFETRVGETFVLGASTWRIEEITHDRVIVSPAPGQPGKLPFWHGDMATRPVEMGEAIGALVRELGDASHKAAVARLVKHHDLDETAADNLVRYLDDQKAATESVPDDKTLVIERTRDELGDWRVCVLSPLGGRVLAPWAMAVEAKVRDETGLDVETMWTNDGFVVRFPDTDQPPDLARFLPGPDEVERLVTRQLGGTALFAAKFREVAARALLLPKRHPGGRAPLWQLRKRASDLLAVASRYPSFPMVLETYRECLRDVFDMPALVSLTRDIAMRRIRVVSVESGTPSPFASALLFGFVANYIYEGDAPLAERRAQALAIDQAQLKELLGETELRDLLDPDAIEAVEAQLQHTVEGYWARNLDAVNDLLLRLGDLSEAELVRRTASPEAADSVDELVEQRRALKLRVAGEQRYVPVEYAARYRDALGVPLPMGLPEVFLAPVPDALGDLVLRYARTHGPFATDEVAARYGLGVGPVDHALERLAAAGKVLEGAFRPGGTLREWCDPEALATIRRRSLAKLRKEVEPVEPSVVGRFLAGWMGVGRRGTGLNALLDAIEKLQGTALAASTLETEILPARIKGFQPADLDALAAAGEVVWVGLEPLGERDGRVALFLTDHLPRLFRPPPLDRATLTDRERRVLEHLERSGASFFSDLHGSLGGGFPGETADALWNLVWKGAVTNDTFAALRGFVRPPQGPHPRRRRELRSLGFRSRRMAPPRAEGRWSLTASRLFEQPTATEQATALAQQLLNRYGIVSREVAQAESVAGGFTAVYDVFKALEESGRIRRGYFVAGVGAMQFALPPALDLLRAMRQRPDRPDVIRLSAVDPANPYGALLKWPEPPPDASRPMRAAGASVVLLDGALAGYLGKGGRQLTVWLPEHEPDRSKVANGVAHALADLAALRREGLLLAEVNGAPAGQHPVARFLTDAGFVPSSQGFYLRRRLLLETDEEEAAGEGEELHA